MVTKRINPYKQFIGSFVPDWLMARKEISQGAKLCYARLCRYAGKDGKCFPKQSTLAVELGVSINMVPRYLKELTAYNLIEVIRQGCGKPNLYYFLNNSFIQDINNSEVQDTHISKFQDTHYSEIQVTHYNEVPSIKRIIERESYEESHTKGTDYSFDDFWGLYDKKTGNKAKLVKKWNSLTEAERKKILEYIPKYVLSTPDKKYRKNPETFLNNRAWEDEIISSSSFGNSQLSINSRVDHSLYQEQIV